MEEGLTRLLALPTEDEWKASLAQLVAAHGSEAIGAWKDGKKHKHRLVHLAVAKSYPEVLRAMVQDHGFDVNAPRDSDQCTPMHLAMFYKKPGVIRELHKLGADLALKNAHGEACDDKCAAFVGSYSNIIWLDLELTHGHYDGAAGGANSGEAPHILEAAVIVTDKDLQELGRWQSAIGGCSKEHLEGLKEFHQLHFRDGAPGGEFPPLPDSPGNGLFSAVLASEATAEAAEEAMLKLLREHCPERACPIAGNSIQCDREVLKVRMPRLYAFLSHQIVDVSTVLGLMDRWLPLKKEEWRADQEANASYDHRAMNDIEASLRSMLWARQHLFVQPTGE